MFHTEFKRHVVERAFLIELGQHLNRQAQILVLASMLPQPGQRLGERDLPRLLRAQVFLHKRVEVLIGLLQRAAIVLPPEQTLDAVGAQPLAQTFGKRLRQAFDDLANPKPLREQSADGIHRVVAAAIHADLRAR